MMIYFINLEFVCPIKWETQSNLYDRNGVFQLSENFWNLIQIILHSQKTAEIFVWNYFCKKNACKFYQWNTMAAVTQRFS